MGNLLKRRKNRTRKQRLMLDLILFIPVILIWLIVWNFPHLTAVGAYRAEESEALLEHISPVSSVDLTAEQELPWGVCKAVYGQSNSVIRIGLVGRTTFPFWNQSLLFLLPCEDEKLSLVYLISTYYIVNGEGVAGEEGWYAVSCGDPAVASVTLAVTMSGEWTYADGSTSVTKNTQTFDGEKTSDGALWLVHFKVAEPEEPTDLASGCGGSLESSADLCRAYDANGNLLYEYQAP